jgi:hypothetical protein
MSKDECSTGFLPYVSIKKSYSYGMPRGLHVDGCGLEISASTLYAFML